MLGYKKEELLSIPFDRICAGGRYNYETALYNIRRAGSIGNIMFEWRSKKKDGSLVWVEVALHKSEIGGKGRILAVVRDISKRKENEKALFLSQASINTSRDSVIWFNTSGKVIYVNNAAHNLLKFSKSELYALSIKNIEINTEPDFWAQRLSTLNKFGALNLETAFKDKEGRSIPVDVSFNFYRYENEEFIFTVVRDITDKKAIQLKEKNYYQRLEKLLEMERKILSAQSSEEIAQAALKHLRIILDCHRASVVLFDKPNDSYKIIALDSSIETKLKKGKEYTLGGSPFAITNQFGSDLKNNFSTESNLTPLDEELKREGMLSRLSIPLIRNQETIGALNLSSTIKNNFTEEKITIAQEVAVSISLALQHSNFIEQINRQNLELEKRIDERTSQLKQTISELESFSYSVSHDLRAPLRSIGGFSQAVIDDYSDKLDDDGKILLGRIISASKRMSDLIDALLMLAKITRSEINVDKVDFSALVSSVAEELCRQNEKRTNVEFRIQPGLKVKGDHRLLRIAIENLLNNAWKFTRDREKAVIEFGETENQGVKAYFVKDNGVGFDMAFSARLFGAFQRLHNGEEFEGTGIGLATTKRIILRHNGTIWAESKINEGTTFFFTIQY